MKKIFGKTLIYITGILLWLVLNTHDSYSQQEWITITPPNEFFSFDFPAEPQEIYNDSLIKLLRYTYVIENTIAMQCILMKHDSSFQYEVISTIDPEDSIDVSMAPDSLFNPLIIMHEIWEMMGDSTNVLVYQNYNLEEDSTIKVMDLGMHSFIGSPDAGYFYTRMYYNGHDVLAFIVSSGENQYQDLVAYKNQYFNSIVIDVQ